LLLEQLELLLVHFLLFAGLFLIFAVAPEIFCLLLLLGAAEKKIMVID